MGFFTKAAAAPTTVDEVMSAFHSTIEKLDAVATTNEMIARDLEVRAKEAQEAAKEASDEATKARRIRIKLKEIVGE